MSRVKIVAILSMATLLAALALAGCGAGADAEKSETPQENTGTAKEQTAANAGQTGSAATGDEAANFTATTLDGEKFDLSEKRGEVVALYFIAGWCGSCIPEAQSWSKLYSAYKDEGLDLLIISVNPNDTRETIEGFRRAGEIRSLPWAIDKTGDVSRSLRIQALESTVIIDRDGRIVYQDSALTPYETLESKLKEVL